MLYSVRHHEQTFRPFRIWLYQLLLKRALPRPSVALREQGQDLGLVIQREVLCE